MTAESKNMLVLNRNYTLNTLKGHSIAFKKDVPIHVPPMIYREALEIGAQPADGEAPEVVEVTRTDSAPADPSDRVPMIMSAIEKLVAENERENFTAAGSPTVEAVSRVVGFKVQGKEIAPVWQKYHDDQAAGKE